jgi:hypothetical protein
MDELEKLIVPFKRKVYREVIREFRHLAAVTPARAGVPLASDGAYGRKR